MAAASSNASEEVTALRERVEVLERQIRQQACYVAQLAALLDSQVELSSSARVDVPAMVQQLDRKDLSAQLALAASEREKPPTSL